MKADGRVRLLRARGSAELGKVASGCATQGLWLGDRKVSFQVIGDDRSRFPGRGTVRELGKKEEESATDRRREYADLGLNLSEREEQVACHTLALTITDKARREVEK